MSKIFFDMVYENQGVVGYSCKNTYEDAKGLNDENHFMLIIEIIVSSFRIITYAKYCYCVNEKHYNRCSCINSNLEPAGYPAVRIGKL